MKRTSFKTVLLGIFSVFMVAGLLYTDTAKAEGDTNEGASTNLGEAQVQEYLMKVTNNGKREEGKTTYQLSPVDPSLYPRWHDFKGVFDEEVLFHKYPMQSGILKGKTLKIQAVPTAPLETTNASLLWIKDWELYGVDPSLTSETVKVTGIDFQEGEFIQYEVEPFGDTGINRISFKKSTLGGLFPTDNLVNSTLLIQGVMATSDNKTLSIRDWMPLETIANDVEVTKPGTYEIHGTISGSLFEEVVGKDTILWAELVDYDGKKYLTRWNRSKHSFTNRNFAGEYTLEVSTITQDTAKPVVEVVNVQKRPNGFEFKTDEVVSLMGTVGELVNSHASRNTYKFNADDKTYYAVFDSEIVGTNDANAKLSGKSLELTGVVNKQNNLIYLGVMGYRDPYAADNYGKVTHPTDATIKMDAVRATPVYLVSYTDNASAYRVVTSAGVEHTFVFDKKMLKENFPTKNIIGQEFNFAIWFDENTKSQNAYLVASMSSTGKNGFEQDRGKFLKVVENSSSATIFSFESIKGGTYNVLLNSASVAKMGGANKVTGQTATIYGHQSTASGERIFDVYMLTPVNVPHANAQKNEIATFTGNVEKISSRDPKGLTLFATNQYGQSEYLYIETDFLKDKFPASIPIEDIVSHEISVTGYRLANGVLLVQDFGFPEVPTYYPNEIKSKIEAPEYFPNMKGFTGILDISDIGGSHLMLITSTDKYILNGKPEVMAQIENNLRNIVYLRGEYREAGSPYWTGEIKVYDIQPLDSNTNTIKNPIGEPVHDLIPDPQKDAHHTIQLHDLPDEFEFGSAIPEAKYFPEIPKVEIDVPSLK